MNFDQRAYDRLRQTLPWTDANGLVVFHVATFLVVLSRSIADFRARVVEGSGACADYIELHRFEAEAAIGDFIEDEDGQSDIPEAVFPKGSVLAFSYPPGQPQIYHWSIVNAQEFAGILLDVARLAKDLHVLAEPQDQADLAALVAELESPGSGTRATQTS